MRDVPDFPKPGIVFKDITPILGHADLFRLSLKWMEGIGSSDGKIDKIVGIDARGFIFGAPLAYRMGSGFIPARKKGKLPHTTEAEAYALEYGEAEIHLHRDAIHPGEKVLLVDDLLATGGTADAAIKVIDRLGGDLTRVVFLVELEFLKGREKIPGVQADSLLKF